LRDRFEGLLLLSEPVVLRACDRALKEEKNANRGPRLLVHPAGFHVLFCLIAEMQFLLAIELAHFARLKQAFTRL
jgi:hypothetical protein